MPAPKDFQPALVQQQGLNGSQMVRVRVNGRGPTPSITGPPEEMAEVMAGQPAPGSSRTFLAGSPKLRYHHVLQADFPHLICAATLLRELSNSSTSRTDDIDDASLRYWTVAALLLSGGNFFYHALGFLLRDTSCGRCCGSGFFRSNSGWSMLSSSTFGSFDRSSALNNLASSNGSSNGSSNHGSQQRRRGNVDDPSGALTMSELQRDCTATGRPTATLRMCRPRQ